MEQGIIASWEVKVGDHVKPGTILAQVETDKAVVAFESVEEGYVARILVPAASGDTKVGLPVLVICEEQADVGGFASFGSAAATAAPANPAPTKAASTAAPAASSTSEPSTAASPVINTGRVVASPLARKVAEEKGINLSQVPGTGPNHRVLAADVKEFVPAKATQAAPAQVATPTITVEAPKAAAAPKAVSVDTPTPSAPATAAPVASGEHVDTPLSNMRKVIANRLTQSKQQVPHYQLTTRITVDNLMKVRATFNKDLPDNEKLSLNDFVIKACAVALKAHPDVNSAWMDKFIRRYNYVDISVAVATPSGLITPIITDADIKGLRAIASDGRGLYAKARAGTLQPHEFQGGTFTISNLGSFGISEFTAIINPPQAVILAVGGIDDKVVATGDEKAPFKSTKVLTVTASLDHRVVDGAVGAAFLATLKSLLENPMKMLL